MPKVPDPYHLPHTGLVISLVPAQQQHSITQLASTQKGKYLDRRHKNVCETYLAGLDRGPGALMILGIHLDEETEKKVLMRD